MDIGAWALGAAFAKALTYATTLGAAGLALFFIYATPLGFPARELEGAIRRLAGASALLTAGKFLLLAGAMAGLAGVIDPTVLHLLLASGEGTAALVRAGGLALLCAGAAGLPGRRALLVTGAALAVVSFAVLGHVHARHSGVLSALLALHLLVAAFWIGALWPLARILNADPPRAAAIVARFSQLALGAVPLLLVAGAVLLVVLLGSVQALWTGIYGRWLCLKLALVGALLTLAARNRMRLSAQLHEPAGRAAMRRAIHAEMGLAAGVLGVTAIVTTLMGPGD